MLELRGVTKRYSGIAAVQNVSFVARAGEVTGYLGLNGSGKSTTLKMITGLIEPSDGEILFRGQPVDRDPMAYRQMIGYVPEEPHLYPHLTGAEYLEMVGQLRGLPEKQLIEKIDGFLSIERFESVSERGKFVSVSFWRDEEAVKQWRNQMDHRRAQSAGRDGIFRDYRLRVAAVMRDYGMHERGEVPKD